jgi:hypothetical protein
VDAEQQYEILSRREHYISGRLYNTVSVKFDNRVLFDFFILFVYVRYREFIDRLNGLPFSRNEDKSQQSTCVFVENE